MGMGASAQIHLDYTGRVRPGPAVGIQAISKRPHLSGLLPFQMVGTVIAQEMSGIDPSRNKRETRADNMKKLTLTLGIVALAFAATTVLAQQGTPGGSGIQQQDRDRIQSSSPDLEQSRTRAHECLPDEAKEALKEMKQARVKYQEQKKEQKKELAGATAEDREQLREQLRESVKEQLRDREQLRERLQEMRECVPTHEQLMQQAREQVRERKVD
jgi:flagellar basal body-associated protein FliL